MLKTVLITGSIAMASLAAALAPAKADSIGLWVNPGIGIGIGGVGVGVGLGLGVGVGPVVHGHVYDDAFPGHCSKADAMDRAASMGVTRRYVSGISQSRISVRGMNRGQPVKVTMHRHSDTCAVRNFSYL
jgi:hypothetical protein